MRSSNTVFLTASAMVAFAANSVLCRLALGQGLIDAASFTSVRVISGALILGVILLARRGTNHTKADWRSVVSLFAYMAFFSFAYLSLGAGSGALVLFGAVQLTMFIVALRAGERFSPLSWFGLALAIGGLVYLVSPGVTAPDPIGAMLMTIAGIAWGFYSLIGKVATDPLAATAYNFLYSVPLVMVTSLLFIGEFDISIAGILLGVASGVVASGLGYVIWYAALRGLTATSAATVQLSAPVIAAIGGVVLLSEDLSVRLVLASLGTLGGIAIVLLQRNVVSDQPASERS